MSRLLLQCGKKFQVYYKNRLLQYSKVEFKPKIPKQSGQNVPVGYVTLKSSTFICGTSLAVIFKQKLFKNNQKLDSSQKNLTSNNVEDSGIDWRELWNLLKAELWLILGSLVAALLGGYINIKISHCLGELVNVLSVILSSTDNSSLSGFKKPAIELIVLYLGQSFTTFAYISLLAKMGENVAARLKYRLFQAVIKQDIAFFDQVRTSTLVDCVTTDIREFASAIKLLISLGVRNSAQLVGGVISLFIVSPIMTVNLSVFIPIVIIVGTYFGSVLRSLSKSAQLESLQTAASFEEAVNNIRTVRAFANEDLECSKFKKHMEETQRLNVLLGCGIGCFEAGTQLFMNSLILGTITLGFRLWFHDLLSPGDILFFLSSAKMIQRSLTQLSILYGQTVKGKQALKRILYFCNLVPEIPDKGDKVIDDKYFQPCVEFKDVSFAYPTRSNQIVLDELTLSIPSGKKVAVVGSSGNGKTTVANLLERFYDADSGEILVSNVNIRDVDPKWLRGSVLGIINQEPVLFATTIKENIRYGKPSATDEEIYEAARNANADKFIRSFPDGYDTILGERGVTISGGQKQRIAIARALIKNPSILILDEATSALDPESERIVQTTLEEVGKNKTVLIIAHRLSTIEKADIIVVLEKGKVVEVGTNEELIAKKGLYWKLMNKPD